MEAYNINKGIGKDVEFRGLTAQYLFLFAGGLLAVFILFVVLYLAGAGELPCIAFGVVAGTGIVWLTFHLNTKYGKNGLMKLAARRSRPRRIIHRKHTRRLLRG